MGKEINITDKIWILSLAIISVLYIFALSGFNKHEADMLTGEGSSLNENWFLVENDKEIPIDFPRTIKSSDYATVFTTLSTKYEGLMVNMTGNNIEVSIYLNDTLIYDRGDIDGLIYIPEFTPPAKLSLNVYPIDNTSSIYIRDIHISRGDAAVLSQIKGNMFQLVCSVIVLLCSSILLFIGIIRKKAKWASDSALRLSVYLFVMFIYGFTATKLPGMFFGNESVFIKVQDISFMMAPALLAIGIGANTENRIEKAIFITILALSALGTGINFAIGKNIVIVSYIGFITLSITNIVKTLKEKFIPKIAWLVSLILYSALGMSDIYKLHKEIDAILILVSAILLTIYQIADFVKDYKEVIERSEKEAINANEAKSAFLASMSHEIRTPINAILGMDEMILRESTEEGIKGYASDINQAGHTLLSLINDILDLSKIESGKMTIIPVDYDVAQMLHNIVNLIYQKAADKGLEFEINVYEQIPKRLMGDDMRIRQAIVNLLSNAVKYTDAGKVTLNVSWQETKTDEGYLICEVSDTGIGIKKDDLKKLFEEYTRFDEKKHRQTEGTGLGLNITRKIISLMGGELKVDSIYKQGSTFSFAIKQEVMDFSYIGEFDDKPQQIEAYIQKYEAPDVKVLIVDDNAMNRKVFKSLIKDSLINVTEASSGKESIGILGKESFDLVFMDHMMPEMDGIETFKHIREGHLCDDTPIVILTANAIVGVKDKYLKEGFNGYLAKPIMPDELDRIILDNIPAEKIRFTGGKRAVETENDIEVEGIDTNYLKLYFKTRDMQIAALKEFYKGAKLQIDKLNDLYKALTEGWGLDDYRICVHAMKSSAANIGAIELFGLAKLLEFSARDNETDTIMALHNIFARKWKSFSINLGHSLGYKKRKKETADPQIVLALLSNIEMAMEVMDVDGADEAVNKLSAYDFGKKTKVFDQLKGAVNDLDIDRVEELSNVLKEDFK